jgi:hypothetical protein
MIASDFGSVHPQMAFLRDFGFGRVDLDSQTAGDSCGPSLTPALNSRKNPPSSMTPKSIPKQRK